MTLTKTTQTLYETDFVALAERMAAYRSGDFNLRPSQKNRLGASHFGKLAPQDPNDEPASVLLEHIRAERKAQKNNKAEKTPSKVKL
jgi:hypothetical protein